MKTNLSETVEKVGNACEEAGKSTILGISLENPSPRLLDVRDGSFDEHVAMQPAAIAYFGVLKKEALRQHDSMKHAYERWQKKKFQEARKALEGASQPCQKKATISDIEAFVIINNERKIEEWETNLSYLQEQVDTLDSWYEAWRQKSFSLREHGQTVSDERKTQPYLFGKKEETDGTPAKRKHQSTIDRVRQMKKNKNGKGDK